MKKFRACVYVVMSLLLISIFANSCSTMKNFKEHDKPKGELAEYVGLVMTLSKGDLYNDNITIGFKNHFDLNPKGGMTIGRCTFHINEIDINKEFWLIATHSEKLILVAHELNHCVCYKGHTKKKFKDGCPSYMGATHPSDKCMKDRFRDYINKIRQGCDLK